MDGVEQGLYIDLTLLSGSAGIRLDKTARELLAIKRSRMEFGAVVEIEFVCDLFNGCIQKHIMTVQNDNRINDILKIPDLMG
jgi:hypothetical protein